MLRAPVLASRVRQMSAAGEQGQVATALKGVLERVFAAAHRSGKDSKVLLEVYAQLGLGCTIRMNQYFGALSLCMMGPLVDM